jgi:hypothetical protein
MSVSVSFYQSVRANLEKMASILEPVIANDALERAEVFKPQACVAPPVGIGPLLID